MPYRLFLSTNSTHLLSFIFVSKVQILKSKCNPQHNIHLLSLRLSRALRLSSPCRPYSPLTLLCYLHPHIHSNTPTIKSSAPRVRAGQPDGSSSSRNKPTLYFNSSILFCCEERNLIRAQVGSCWALLCRSGGVKDSTFTCLSRP
jgi:hypothetical protein